MYSLQMRNMHTKQFDKIYIIIFTPTLFVQAVKTLVRYYK